MSFIRFGTRRLAIAATLVLLIAGFAWWMRRAPGVAPRPSRELTPQRESPFQVPVETSPLPWRAWSDSTFVAARSANQPIVVLLDAAWSECSQLYAATLAASDTLRALLESELVAVRVDIDRRPDVHARFHVTFDTVPTVVLMTPSGRVWDARDAPTAAELVEAFSDLMVATPRGEDSEVGLLQTTNSAAQDGASATEPEARVAEVLAALAEAWPHNEAILDFDTPTLSWDALGFLRAHAEVSNAPVSRALFLQGLRQLLASRLLRGGAMWRDIEAAVDRVSRAAFLETNAALLDHYATAARWTDDAVYRDAAHGMGAFLAETLWDAQHGLFRAAQGTLVLNANGWPLLTGQEHASMRGHEQAAALEPAVVSVFPTAANARACAALLRTRTHVDLAQRALDALWSAFEQHGRLPHDFSVDDQGQLRTSTHDFAIDYADVGMVFLTAAALAPSEPEKQLWIERARALADRLSQDFAVAATGLFRDARAPTAVAPERMHVRLTPLVDNARVARFLRLLTVHTGESRYENAARAALQAWSNDLWSRSVWEASEYALAILAAPL